MIRNCKEYTGNKSISKNVYKSFIETPFIGVSILFDSVYKRSSMLGMCKPYRKGEKALKLSNVENPISGKSFNLFSIGDWWKMIAGAGALFIVFSLGQRVANIAGTKVPGLTTTVVDPVTHPAAPNPNDSVVIY